MALMGSGDNQRKSNRNNSGLKGQPYQTLEERQLFQNEKVFDSLFESQGSTQSARDLKPGFLGNQLSLDQPQTLQEIPSPQVEQKLIDDQKEQNNEQ